MTTRAHSHAQMTEFSKINPEFYDKLTYTQILFFINSALGHIRFFFDNTDEKQLLIRIEDIEQIDPNRRIDWSNIDEAEKQQAAQMLVARLTKEGYATQISADGLVAIDRARAHKTRQVSERRLKNNRDVPLIQRLLRRSF